MGSLAQSKYSAVSEAVHTAAGAGAAMGWVSLSFLMLKHSMDPSVGQAERPKTERWMGSADTCAGLGNMCEVAETVVCQT